MVRKVKNFVEGYWEVLDRVRTKAYLMKNNKEFYETASKGYQTMVVK